MQDFFRRTGRDLDIQMQPEGVKRAFAGAEGAMPAQEREHVVEVTQTGPGDRREYDLHRHQTGQGLAERAAPTFRQLEIAEQCAGAVRVILPACIVMHILEIQLDGRLAPFFVMQQGAVSVYFFRLAAKRILQKLHGPVDREPGEFQLDTDPAQLSLGGPFPGRRFRQREHRHPGYLLS